jgi:hypothetical protein
MNRKLIDGSEVPELEEAQTLMLKTKCPEKWLLVDRETGEIYTPYSTPGPNQWKKIDFAKWVPPNA